MMWTEIQITTRATTHLLERPKSKHRHHQVLARTWSPRNPHSLLVGTQMVPPPCNAAWRFLAKLTVDHHTIRHRAPWHLPKGVKTCGHTKPARGHVSSFTHNWENLKPSRCPSGGEWINWSIRPHTGIVFSTKKKHAVRPWNDRRGGTWNAHDCVQDAHVKRPHSMWFQRDPFRKRQHYGPSNEIGHCQEGLGGER